MNPNSILHIASFIHLCEAYLGIRSHFNLFYHLFILKANKNVIGGAGFQLRSGRASVYMGFPLKTSLKGWHPGWFYVSDPSPSLPPFDGHKPITQERWSSLPSAQDMAQVNRLMEFLEIRKGEGVTGVAIVLNFVKRRVQPIKERVHPGDKYIGTADPTRESEEPSDEQEVIRRVKSFFLDDVIITNVGCPMPHSASRPAEEVSFESSVLLVV